MAFIIASLILTVLGFVSLAIKGGPRYGIEFKGGMLMTVKFQGAPPLDAGAFFPVEGAGKSAQRGDLRKRLERDCDRHEGADDATLAKNQQLVLDTLAKTFGHPENGKLDLNNASAGTLADRLRDPFQKAGIQLSDPQIDELAAAIVGLRNKPGACCRVWISCERYPA